jgi:hypothetical protein
MAAKIGDIIQTLPVDPQQDFPHMDMNFIDEYVKSTKKSKGKKEKFVEEYHSDSESEDDYEESDTEEHTHSEHKPSLMQEIKATFLASLIFVVLSLDIVNTTLNTLGIEGLKLLIVKFFIFASIYFVVRYRFM